MPAGQYKRFLLRTVTCTWRPSPLPTLPPSFPPLTPSSHKECTSVAPIVSLSSGPQHHPSASTRDGPLDGRPPSEEFSDERKKEIQGPKRFQNTKRVKTRTIQRSVSPYSGLSPKGLPTTVYIRSVCSP